MEDSLVWDRDEGKSVGDKDETPHNLHQQIYVILSFHKNPHIMEIQHVGRAKNIFAKDIVLFDHGLSLEIKTWATLGPCSIVCTHHPPPSYVPARKSLHLYRLVPVLYT